MITLITGGSKCGKSSLAEQIMDHYNGSKIYIATMQPFGQDAYEAIERHRIMRKNKHYKTIEKYTNIHEIELDKNCSVLLECVGNLCANEMFAGNEIYFPSDKIVNEIRAISESASNLVIVTNQVGSDGIDYSQGTNHYIRELGTINSQLAIISDNVIESIYGIPIVLKGEIPC